MPARRSSRRSSPEKRSATTPISNSTTGCLPVTSSSISVADSWYAPPSRRRYPGPTSRRSEPAAQSETIPVLSNWRVPWRPGRCSRSLPATACSARSRRGITTSASNITTTMSVRSRRPSSTRISTICSVTDRRCATSLRPAAFRPMSKSTDRSISARPNCKVSSLPIRTCSNSCPDRLAIWARS